MDVSFFQELLARISDRGRQILDLSFSGNGQEETLEGLCRVLVSTRGEASGVALAQRILNRYEAASDEERDKFFAFLAKDFQPKPGHIEAAVKTYLENPTPLALSTLFKVVEPPAQELLRRLNLAPGGTATLVKMREDLLERVEKDHSLAAVDNDFVHLFSSWFNRGFLVLARLSWSSPASILEKIIEYEAVHEIKGWDDLRRRLDPADRRCFAFFHPALVDDPLIFVEVALEKEIPASIHAVLESYGGEEHAPRQPTVAVFYSISNCQDGLRGISFGNFLIKQVVEDLKKDIPSLKTFVTLSPVPRFKEWLFRELDNGQLAYLPEGHRKSLMRLKENGWDTNEAAQNELKPAVMAAAAHYFLLAKDRSGRPFDPVARFHLGNGAALERINWLADISQKGLDKSLSLMVNYRYELKDIERNHEAYINQGIVAASKAVRGALLAPEKSKALVPTQ